MHACIHGIRDVQDLQRQPCGNTSYKTHWHKLYCCGRSHNLDNRLQVKTADCRVVVADAVGEDTVGSMVQHPYCDGHKYYGRMYTGETYSQ